jgi:hypothetical protein
VTLPGFQPRESCEHAFHLWRVVDLKRPNQWAQWKSGALEAGPKGPLSSLTERFSEGRVFRARYEIRKRPGTSAGRDTPKKQVSCHTRLTEDSLKICGNLGGFALSRNVLRPMPSTVWNPFPLLGTALPLLGLPLTPRQRRRRRGLPYRPTLPSFLDSHGSSGTVPAHRPPAAPVLAWVRVGVACGTTSCSRSSTKGRATRSGPESASARLGKAIEKLMRCGAGGGSSERGRSWGGCDL